MTRVSGTRGACSGHRRHDHDDVAVAERTQDPARALQVRTLNGPTKTSRRGAAPCPSSTRASSPSCWRPSAARRVAHRAGRHGDPRPRRGERRSGVGCDRTLGASRAVRRCVARAHGSSASRGSSRGQPPAAQLREALAVTDAMRYASLPRRRADRYRYGRAGWYGWLCQMPTMSSDAARAAWSATRKSRRVQRVAVVRALRVRLRAACRRSTRTGGRRRAEQQGRTSRAGSGGHEGREWSRSSGASWSMRREARTTPRRKGGPRRAARAHTRPRHAARLVEAHPVAVRPEAIGSHSSVWPPGGPWSRTRVAARGTHTDTSCGDMP